MSLRLKLKQAAAKDLYKLVKKNKSLGRVIINQVLPEIVENPFQGRMKQGDLSQFRSWDFNFKGSAYRVLYEIEGDLVRIFAIGVHDVSYRKAKSRTGSS
jgi:mRNA-degrading endonuclease RelE of RelBE toxin-antitoxin system